MTKSIIQISLLAILTISICHAQSRNNNYRSSEPTEKELEKRQKKIEERRAELIDNFLFTLEADEFQVQIIKQYLNSYIEEKEKLMNVQFSRLEERERANKNLRETHFTDLEGLISENDINSINKFITGGFNEKKAKRKKKKEKKKNKNRD